MLGEHLDDFGIGDGVVQVVAEFVGEGLEGLHLANVRRIADDGGDAGDVGVRDLGDVIGPVFPVAAVAAFLDDLGVEGAFQLAHVELELWLNLGAIGRLGFSDGVLAFPGVAVVGGFGFLRFLLDLIGDGDDFHLPVVLADEVELVDEGIEAVVMGAEGLEHIPHDFIDLVVIERLVRFHPGGDDDGEDDVTEFLFPIRRAAHDSADGLDDIHLGIPRSEEEHGIQRGNIHAFRETADVAENAAGIFRSLGLEPVQLFLFLAGVHAAVHVRGLAEQGNVGVFLLLIGLDDFLEHVCDLLGADLVFPAALLPLDDLTESDGAFHRLGIRGEIGGDALLRESLPAADDAGGVVHLELVVVVLEEILESGIDVILADGEDENLVVGEEF